MCFLSGILRLEAFLGNIEEIHEECYSFINRDAFCILNAEHMTDF